MSIEFQRTNTVNNQNNQIKWNCLKTIKRAAIQTVLLVKNIHSLNTNSMGAIYIFDSVPYFLNVIIFAWCPLLPNGFAHEQKLANIKFMQWTSHSNTFYFIYPYRKVKPQCVRWIRCNYLDACDVVNSYSAHTSQHTYPPASKNAFKIVQQRISKYINAFAKARNNNNFVILLSHYCTYQTVFWSPFQQNLNSMEGGGGGDDGGCVTCTKKKGPIHDWTGLKFCSNASHKCGVHIIYGNHHQTPSRDSALICSPFLSMANRAWNNNDNDIVAVAIAAHI